MYKKTTGFLLTMPVVLASFLFCALPFGRIIQYATHSGTGDKEKWVGLYNFSSIFRNTTFRMAAWNTLKFLLIGLPLILLIAYTIALLLKNQVKKHALLKSVFLLPYIMPVEGTVLLIQLIFSQRGGLLPRLHILLGLPLQDWLESEWAFGIALLLYLWKNTGYAVILLLAGLMTIPDEQYKVASLDGASKMQCFFRITTPQMWYSVFFTLLFSMINAFKCFREIFLVGGEHPHRSIYMLQHYLNNSFQNLNYHKLAVASLSLFCVVFISVLIAYLFVQKKEAYKK